METQLFSWNQGGQIASLEVTYKLHKGKIWKSYYSVNKFT